jgi:hypothetical protein
LKPSFNKSSQDLFSAPKSAPEAAKAASEKQRDRVMASITSNSLSGRAIGHAGRSGAGTGFKAFWRQFFARAFDPYRPELHYMRGPGPAWRAKHGTAAAYRLTAGEL